MHNLLQAVEWSNQQFEGPGLQDYGLATPLTFTAEQGIESRKERKRKEEKKRKEKAVVKFAFGTEWLSSKD